MGASGEGRRDRHDEPVFGIAVGSPSKEGMCRKKERKEEVWER